MRESGDFVKACEVYWGEWIPCEEIEETLENPKILFTGNYQTFERLQTTDDPETIFLEKEAIGDNLPTECKTLVGILINIPEEMYLVNGKLKKTFFRKLVRAKTGWSAEKVERVYSKLKTILTNQR